MNLGLDPELSNLSIVTVGAGVELLRSSSLDLVYHYYRLVEPADSITTVGAPIVPSPLRS